MGDTLILAIVVLILVVAAMFIARRSRSKASCCGSSGYTAKSRKLKTVAAKKTFRVEGMHCQNCVNRVMEDVQDIPGTSAVVNLKKGSVTVSMEQDMEDSVIIAAIEKHGYKVL